MKVGRSQVCVRPGHEFEQEIGETLPKPDLPIELKARRAGVLMC